MAPDRTYPPRSWWQTLFARPRIEHLTLRPARALGGGRSEVELVVRGAGLLRVGATRRWFWGTTALVARVTAPAELEVRCRGLGGAVAQTLVLAPSPTPPPAGPSVELRGLTPHLRPERLHAGLRFPRTPRFRLPPLPRIPSSKESPDE